MSRQSGQQSDELGQKKRDVERTGEGPPVLGGRTYRVGRATGRNVSIADYYPRSPFTAIPA